MRTGMNEPTGSARGTVLVAQDSGAGVGEPLARGRFEEWCIAQAVAILGRRLAAGSPMRHPEDVKAYLAVKYSAYRHECFAVMFLDADNRLISMEEMFRGTLTQTAVYPREVARRALELNANAVVLAHNHPSGRLDPSLADERLTARIKEALMMFDIRVLDHIIVGGGAALSMAERGLL